jgi:DNA-binding MarR family transcriptional regulator
MAINFKGLYQRFIELQIASESKSDFPMLDPIEKRVLSLFSSYWLNQRPLTVVEAINLTDEFSTSTIHRYLKQLRKKGYVELIVDKNDNRVKYVSATKQVDKYFATLGKLMVKASD